ncbi:MAG: hypothetical protein WCJ30_00965 [Deltaproteobacteria bacterium]
MFAPAGCATVNPTLTPARVLRPGHGAFDLGTAYQAPVVAAALGAAHTAAGEITRGNNTAANQDALARGTIAFAQVPPGPAPYVAGRVGIAGDNEAHFAVAGRTMRLGARHRFWTDSTGDWALTLGVQARVAPLAVLMDGTVPGVSVASSWLAGGDVALLVGRTSSELYDIWIGARAGYTHAGGSLQSMSLNGGAAFDATLDRVDAALTLGLRVGFGHVAGMIEAEIAGGYYQAAASFGASASGGVLALVPAAALRLQF